jgi:hypothetical protein
MESFTVRGAATWLAALFVSSMLLAAAASTAHVL